MIRRLSAAFGLSLMLLAAAPAVSAAPMVFATAEEETTTTTVDPNAPRPAVEAPVEGEDEVEHPWTTRYLVPTFLLIGALGVLASLAFYGARIRARYRVVR